MQGSRLKRLEAARGFAACYVVAHHTIGHGLAICRFGQEAVMLFFLLSGFVIHHSYLRRPTGALRYIFNRFCRIYLPLIPVFVLSYAVACIVAGHLLGADVPGLIGNLLMLQDIAEMKPGVIVAPYMGDGPLWSLSYEWWFYVVYIAILALPSTVHRSCFVTLIGCLSAIAYIWQPIWPLRVGYYLTIWWCGALMAESYIANNARGLPNRPNFYVVLPMLPIVPLLLTHAWVAGGIYPGAPVGLSPLLEVRHFVGAFIIVAVAYSWQSLGWRGFSALMPFAILAPISYGIYIAHVPLLQLPIAVAIPAILCVAVVIELWFYPAARQMTERLFSVHIGFVRMRIANRGG